MQQTINPGDVKGGPTPVGVVSNVVSFSYFLSLPIGGSWVWFGYSSFRMRVVQKPIRERNVFPIDWKSALGVFPRGSHARAMVSLFLGFFLSFVLSEILASLPLTTSWSLFHYSLPLHIYFHFMKILCNMTIILPSSKFLVSHLPLSLALEEMF